MSKRIDRRIEEIKKDRKELLETVKANLANSGSKYAEYLDKIIKALEINEDTSKKYSSYVAAQNMIVSLTQEVLEAKTKEEVVALRNRINYYINKIKSEIKNRNISTTTLETYQEESNKLRTEIAKTVRVLKREDNLKTIDSLYSRIDELSEEELALLKKLLRREKSFNTNFFKPPRKRIKKESAEEFGLRLSRELDEILKMNSKKEEAPKLGRKASSNPTKCDRPIIITFDDKKEEALPKKENGFVLELENLIERVKSKSSSSSHTFVNVGDKDFEEVEEDILNGASTLMDRYNIHDTRDYGTKKIKNFVSLLLNIPRVVHNKMAIRRMQKDYFNFYRGNDLAGVIEYQRSRNSVAQALKCVFSNSHLRSQEVKYLNRHEDCARWLYEFFKKHSMSIPVQKAYHM